MRIAGIDETIKLRSELILTAMTHFRPDVFLVDKKPYGVENELQDTLGYAQTCLPETRHVLLLRDILDSADVTRKVWKKQRYYEAIQELYDVVLVVGQPEIFDLREEYQFPTAVSDRVRFCGYIRRAPGRVSADVVRHDLHLQDEKLILVTAGGGEDGYDLLANYIAGLAWRPAEHNMHSLIIYGPEMPSAQRAALFQAAAQYPQVCLREFTNDMLSYIGAADVVVSMGGYNTVCEVLSLHKQAVVVPRVRPVAEQWIRAERMAHLGLLHAIHPDTLTPEHLMATVSAALRPIPTSPAAPWQLDLNALPRITQHISALLGDGSDTDYLPRAHQRYNSYVA